jgi:hypothetical protein
MTPDDDVTMAAADLVGRTGATELQVGYLHDDVPVTEAAWFAHAQYKGARVTVEDQPGPAEALDGLARRLLDGGRCVRCGRPIGLDDEDGRPGLCQWRRSGPRWAGACETPGPPAATSVRLADALAAIPGVPGDMIRRAREGHYHDYLSPLAMPEVQLLADLGELASRPATPRNSRPLLRAVADAVRRGEYEASREESDAWAASPEGQETFRMLLGPGGST